MTDDAAERVGDGVASDDEPSDRDAYAGVLGAFPYAVRSSESLLFKTYALAGGFLALAVTLLFALSIVVLLGASAAAAGGSFTFSRAFFIFVGLLVVAPLLAPVLFVARRHRRGRPTARYDATLAALGYLFVASLFVAGAISTPTEFQEPATGLFAPAVEFLYVLPSIAGLLPPLLAAALIWIVGRRLE